MAVADGPGVEFPFAEGDGLVVEVKIVIWNHETHKAHEIRISKMTHSKLCNPSLPFVSFVYFVDKNISLPSS